MIGTNRLPTSSTEETPVCWVSRVASCLYRDNSASISYIWETITYETGYLQQLAEMGLGRSFSRRSLRPPSRTPYVWVYHPQRFRQWYDWAWWSEHPRRVIGTTVNIFVKAGSVLSKNARSWVWDRDYDREWLWLIVSIVGDTLVPGLSWYGIEYAWFGIPRELVK